MYVFPIGYSLRARSPVQVDKMYIFYLIMIIIVFVQWIFTISGRMFDLCINRLWLFPYIASYAIVIWAMARGSHRQFVGTWAVALLAQLPLMLFPSRRNSEFSKREDSEVS
jgi:hypothetical protein